MFRTSVALGVALAVAVPAAAGTTAPGRAATARAAVTRTAAAQSDTAQSDTTRFVDRANAERSARGLRPYAVRADLAEVAHRHAARMAAAQRLYHNPRLGQEVRSWRAVGENVGRGGDADAIHEALMDSPTHRDNILDRAFTEIGVGTVRDGGGVLWVTQVFRLPDTVAAPAPRPPVVSRPAPAPRAAVADLPGAPAAPPVRVGTPASGIRPVRVTALADGTAAGSLTLLADALRSWLSRVLQALSG